jgi:hypothetical protein
MNSFRPTEILFAAIGGALMVIAFILSQGDALFFQNSSERGNDPFAAHYAPLRAVLVPQPTPTPKATPVLSTEEQFRKEMAKIQMKRKAHDDYYAPTTPSAPAQATPRRVYEKEKIYLLKPANQSIFYGVKKDYSMEFKFEVDPKDTVATIEVYFKGKMIHSQELPVSKNGVYNTAVTLEEPGLYQWKVKSAGYKGELRYFTLRR